LLTVSYPYAPVNPYGAYGIIFQEPQLTYFRDTNFADGEYYYSTNSSTNDVNPVTFSNFDGIDVCGLGTQVAPAETGAFIARIEGFDDLGSLGFVDVAGTDGDADAAFVGISSETPMTEIQVSLVDTAGGYFAGFFGVNRVDLTACVEEPPEPEVPVLSCEGFAAPMDRFPVTLKGKSKRVFPLMMNLFDEAGFEQTDMELAAAPVVMVMYTPTNEGEAEDVTDELLLAKKASSGNSFVYTQDLLWQFNLSSRNYTAKGTYLVTVLSGNEEEYVIDPSCVTSFVR
jgi:hypothetical protein